jgi:folate-binding protein YgfZ
LVVDAGFGTVVEQRLRRFWLRTKAELSTRFNVPTLAVRAWPDGLAVPAAEDVTPGGADPILVAPAPWPTHPGFDLIGDGATLPDDVVRLEGDAGRQALERARVASGVPAMGTEIGPDTIPAAARVVEASVDFTKGCYTGQELVARIDSRGNVTPTRLVLLTGDGEVPQRDAALSVDGTDRASVTTAVPAAGEGWTGLGYLHRTVDTPAELTLADGQPVHAVDPG